MKDALRAGQKVRLGALRMLSASVKNREVELRREVTDEEFLEVVAREERGGNTISPERMTGRVVVNAVSQTEVEENNAVRTVARIAGQVAANLGSRVFANEHAQLAFFVGGQKLAIPGEKLTPSVCGNFGVK